MRRFALYCAPLALALTACAVDPADAPGEDVASESSSLSFVNRFKLFVDPCLSSVADAVIVDPVAQWPRHMGWNVQASNGASYGQGLCDKYVMEVSSLSQIRSLYTYVSYDDYTTPRPTPAECANIKQSTEVWGYVPQHRVLDADPFGVRWRLVPAAC